jgi:Fur family transcriptional regulator, peroxide stress response regulator
MVETNSYVNELLKKNIHPSHQRVMILKYLVENQCHPTVDAIFCALRKQIPTLSKATVYNTLNVFVEAKLVRVLSIEDNETRYDILMENHGHFKCSACDRIYNFAVNIDRFVSDDLRNFQISEKNVYFGGICPACITKTEK